MLFFFLFLFTLGAIAVGIGAIVWGAHVQRERSRRMRAAANLMGFDYVHQGNKKYHQQFAPFSLFQSGGGRAAANVLEGAVGHWRVHLFDFRYVISTGHSAHSYWQTVVLLPTGGVGLPEFYLGPKAFYHNLFKLFGYQGISLDEHEAFTKAYVLRGQEVEAIRQVFNEVAIDRLTSDPTWTVEVKAGQFIAYRSQQRCPPERCPEFLAEALRIRECLTAP
jgi:hypothetical protein